MGKKYKRSKKTHKTARSAWADISKKTGLKPGNVVKTKHTKKYWQWETAK